MRGRFCRSRMRVTLFLLPDIYMQLVQEAMIDRRKQYAGECNERNTAEQCIESREYFRAVAIEMVHGAHSGQNHGCVQKRIDPGKIAVYMVAQGADADRKEQDQSGKKCVPDLPPGKLPSGQQRFFMMLEGHTVFSFFMYSRIFASIRGKKLCIYPCEPCPGGWRNCLVFSRLDFQHLRPANPPLLEVRQGRIRILEPRDTICISTQAGCPLGCSFCMTALME